MKIGPRKLEVIKKIDIVDRMMLEFCNSKPSIHPEKLTMKDLKRLLDAFNTMYELFVKCSDQKGETVND